MDVLHKEVWSGRSMLQGHLKEKNLRPEIQKMWVPKREERGLKPEWKGKSRTGHTCAELTLMIIWMTLSLLTFYCT